MPETSSAGSAGPTPRGSKPPAASSSGAGGSKLPPWLSVAALVVAVIAVILAVIGWFRPSTGGSYSDQEKQDAKSRICQAQGTVRQATDINTNMSNPVPGDNIGALAVAANARLALYGGGGYLHQRLDAEPATSEELSKAVTSMANTMQELGINYLAGASANSEVQQPLREDLRSQIATLDNLCQQ